MTSVVAEMQRRYSLLDQDDELRQSIALRLHHTRPRRQTTAVHGLRDRRAVVGRTDAEPGSRARTALPLAAIGYRAAPFPMWPSITEGRNELIRQINLFPARSRSLASPKGAVVAGQVFKHDILPTDGVLHLDFARRAQGCHVRHYDAGSRAPWSDGLASAPTHPASSTTASKTPPTGGAPAHSARPLHRLRTRRRWRWKRMVCKINHGPQHLQRRRWGDRAGHEFLARPRHWKPSRW